jgi:hypothetical protein
MASVPKGTTYFVASAFAAAKTITAISNASEAVVNSVAHGFANGDVVEVTSGWGRLNLRAFRVKSATTDNVTLEGADTSNTTFFPPGSGIGSMRKVNTWTQIQQVLDVQPSGGDPRNVTYSYHESDQDFSINDGFNATSYTFELDADSISTAGYASLRTLTDVQTNTLLRISLRNGSNIYQPSTVALNEAVRMQNGQVNRVVCAFNGNNRPTRYAS